MSFEHSPPATRPRNLRWILAAMLALLFIAAATSFLGPFLVLLSLGVIAVGVIALIRGRLPGLKITSRQTATDVLLIGVYLLFLGAVTSLNTDGDAPIAAAAGDSCDMVGSIHEQEFETLYCTPSPSGELILANATDFTAYQEAEAEELKAKATEEAEKSAEAASKELEEELTAAEERAENAEAKVEEYKEQLEEEQAARVQAEEDAETAKTERDNQSQPEPAPTRNAPAPAPPDPAPAPESNNTDVSTPFKNCTEARDAGAAPVLRGEPGYGPHLDRDGDGIGCE